MAFLLELVVVLIILGLIFWAVNALAGAFGIPPPIVVVIQVLLVIVFVLYLLSAFGLVGGLGGRPLVFHR